MARRKPRYQREEEIAAQDAECQSDKPPRQIPADIAQQAPHNSYGGVPLFYEDKEFTCVDCGRVEVWTAEDQKWWYETAKGYICSTAVRCLACRNTLLDRHGGTPRRSHRDQREQGQSD